MTTCPVPAMVATPTLSIAEQLHDLLLEKQQTEKWQWLCTELLREEQHPSEQVSTLRNRIHTWRVADRPFYLTVANTLTYCFDNQGRLPDYLLSNPVSLLNITNMDRIQEIQGQLHQIQPEKDSLSKFLFEFLSPADWRILLHLRTTAGGSDLEKMPPSLQECITSFIRVYEKKNAKPRRHGQPYMLSVGAKALSKHWHRDRQAQFWGVCTGTESEKNKHAEDVMIKILNDAVWMNIHGLPHDEMVYEVRQHQGYGLRWKLQDGEEWKFRGFLEPQMQDGHSIGWIH
ncbi:hypothetical protein O0I10_009474 [Lichtheimia ornata]|uniref:Uncharacterized protein n=1 Tax=Lichtheimia ornata TaxID=688661 RepID=A0AAD7UWF8_9FUNG|nr:uncharacterized protein O0I10_009474 [Lichtheimia ornata]KAJ8654909.1 hypothetical protein O0I10_009474 [Lichtheimia ornata]